MAQDVQIVVNKHIPYAVQVFERIGKVTAFDTHEITKDAVKDATYSSFVPRQKSIILY